MRIPIASVRQLLVQGRIFIGQGTRNIEDTGLGFPEGSELTVERGIKLEPYTTFWKRSAKNLVTMGAFSYTHSVLPSVVEVGRYTSIAKGMTVMGAQHPFWWSSTSPVFYNQQAMAQTYMHDNQISVAKQEFRSSKATIRIGNDVWIGENVTLAHGVQIGNGAVIASNAVVTKDVAAYTIVGGLPAKKIRDRFDSGVSQKLLETRWWDYGPEQVASCNVTSPQGFAESMARLIESDEIQKYEPIFLTYRDFELVAKNPQYS